MMEKVQRFGSAMLAPVLLFAVAGLAVALAIIAQNEQLFGGLAAPGTAWSNFWRVWESGAWTVFNQMELLFVLGLPIALARTANARAVLEAALLYLTFNYFVAGFLEVFGGSFGIDYAAEPGGESGLKLIAGIKTLDTGILGAIFISAVAVWIHNRYFDKKLPEFLGIFQGSQFVYIVGILVMMPLALIVCLVWPQIQLGISSLQGFLVTSGSLGVGAYTFLERILIPTGLHHFVYSPFVFGPAVVPEGIQAHWVSNLTTYAESNAPLKEQFPGGGFALHGNPKVFAPLGIAAAFYTTARPEKRKATLALLVPVVLTAMLTGITEPLEFTFLFIAPLLFAVHAVLSGLMTAIMYQLGLSGNMGAGLIDVVTQNWVPLWAQHHATYLMQIGVGLCFTVVYFALFRFLILKLDLKTPGREENKDVKLYSKQEYREAKKNGRLGAAPDTDDAAETTPGAVPNAASDAGSEAPADDPYSQRATDFLRLLGGADNIADVNNCATRLRVSVKDPARVADPDSFSEAGALGLVNKGTAVQVIVGMDVPQVRDRFEGLMAHA
ncbi:alpha-glucoside-specific PTS transporter subunit IIBC [Corynebacterium mastitidis]|uniref:alpha-glucoside-specific PTS transporter subunit IIBC n=1 Tax=Corynebacterium mastitidis TaxID=161890 RepID=UPI00254D8BB9|nr:alpha-glucoside-specific PTS transporter subunit IIBC [Corynebacterium mastitidis]MDK8450707.1 alpha-glucoside-specific PTS transporter subunit IIBC [Corynebacterium mastitidis]